MIWGEENQVQIRQRVGCPEGKRKGIGISRANRRVSGRVQLPSGTKRDDKSGSVHNHAYTAEYTSAARLKILPFTMWLPDFNVRNVRMFTSLAAHVVRTLFNDAVSTSQVTQRRIVGWLCKWMIR